MTDYSKKYNPAAIPHLKRKIIFDLIEKEYHELYLIMAERKIFNRSEMLRILIREEKERIALAS